MSKQVARLVQAGSARLVDRHTHDIVATAFHVNPRAACDITLKQLLHICRDLARVEGRSEILLPPTQVLQLPMERQRIATNLKRVRQWVFKACGSVRYGSSAFAHQLAGIAYADGRLSTALIRGSTNANGVRVFKPPAQCVVVQERLESGLSVGAKGSPSEQFVLEARMVVILTATRGSAWHRPKFRGYWHRGSTYLRLSKPRSHQDGSLFDRFSPCKSTRDYNCTGVPWDTPWKATFERVTFPKMTRALAELVRVDDTLMGAEAGPTFQALRCDFLLGDGAETPTLVECNHGFGETRAGLEHPHLILSAAKLAYEAWHCGAVNRTRSCATTQGALVEPHLGRDFGLLEPLDSTLKLCP